MCPQKTEAATGILRGVLGREPTHDEIIGKVDISKTKKRKLTWATSCKKVAGDDWNEEEIDDT